MKEDKIKLDEKSRQILGELVDNSKNKPKTEEERQERINKIEEKINEHITRKIAFDYQDEALLDDA